LARRLQGLRHQHEEGGSERGMGVLGSSTDRIRRRPRDPTRGAPVGQDHGRVTAFCMAYKLGFIPEDEWKREYEPFIEKAVRWLMEGPYLTRGTRADTGHLPTPRPWTITTSSTRPGPA